MRAARTWKIKEKLSEDLITQLLLNRDLKTKEEIDRFFDPKIEYFKKELNIANIAKAQARIKKAIELQELIVVFGDYDVDGITSCAILYKALTEIGAKVLPYIPHREKEGYGLSKTGLEFARDSGASVVITVDNGIVALEAAKFAKDIGLDLIITDHHVPLEKKPEAYTIIHSTLMCGAGVAWSLIKDMVKEDTARDLLQFVAIATICDMIPLLGLGRAFVKEGIKVLNRTKNIGLINLSLECGTDLSKVGSYEIGHILGPRLNAIGRLEHAIDALRLLCTKDPIKAKKLSGLLCETNTKRQVLTEKGIGEAKLLIDDRKKIHVVSSADWNPGIIGLIAARVSEEYYRPAIAISVGELHAKGSARSIGSINIVEVIRKCSDILIDVGGHKGAAGFSINAENIETFKKRLEKLMDDQPDQMERVLEIEAEIESKILTKTLVKELDKFAPFGFHNPSPLFATRNLRITDIRTLSEGKHLKFKADDIDSIAFGMGEYGDILKSGQLIDLAYYLEINEFRGNQTLQLKVKDISTALT